MYVPHSAEAVLFAYNGFYVELTVCTHTDEITGIRLFRCGKKLEPFLHQVDIGEVTLLLSLSK